MEESDGGEKDMVRWGKVLVWFETKHVFWINEKSIIKDRASKSYDLISTFMTVLNFEYDKTIRIKTKNIKHGNHCQYRQQFVSSLFSTYK